MKKGYIYKITNPKGKIYIGQTTNYELRTKYYKRLSCKGQIKLYRSLLKYGFDQHNFEIIEIVDLENLNIIETEYISKYNCVKEGLNCAIYGDSPMRGRKHNTSTKEKMSSVRKGVPLGPMSTSHKEALSLARKEGLKSGKIKHARLGKKLSKESKEKMRTAKLGRTFSESHRLAMSISRTGKVRGKYKINNE